MKNRIIPIIVASILLVSFVLSGCSNNSKLTMSTVEGYFESKGMDKAADTDEYNSTYSSYNMQLLCGNPSTLGQYLVLSDTDSCSESLKDHKIFGDNAKNLEQALRYEQRVCEMAMDYQVDGVFAVFDSSENAEECFDNLFDYTNSLYNMDDAYYKEFSGEENEFAYKIVDTESHGLYCMYQNDTSVLYIKTAYGEYDTNDHFVDFKNTLENMCSAFGVPSPLEIIDRDLSQTGILTLEE